MCKIAETRSLFFTPDEVLNALIEYQRRRECLRFDETIEGCSFELDYSGEITWYQLTRGSDGYDQVDGLSLHERANVCRDISASDIVAALVFYCRNARIPLPATAEKSLRLADGRIAMTFVISEPDRKGG